MNFSNYNVPALVYRKEYQPPNYFIDKVHLNIELGDVVAVVMTKLEIRRNPRTPLSALVLDGVNLELKHLSIDGKALCETDYDIDKETLTINHTPDNFTLKSIVTIKPEENSILVGLYKNQGIYSTQCEPQGFRYITYFLDRPDILSEYFVTIQADKARYPVLLANGNLIEEKNISLPSKDSRALFHQVRWHDPFPKPCYLFAIVAGNLVWTEEHVTTASGRQVSLRIYAANHADLAKCHHAMAITKQAMAWDEKKYGREYDLAIFMLVAVPKTNVGGQENKGLNIYRTDKLLVDPETTLDTDIQSLTETVSHEYFHNWSGNRVTCRDWFQLTLKEGFTTYRGLEFCQGLYSKDAMRIGETRFIRNKQFAEDISPLAHSIRPDSYRAIWNFYTPTVYQKGAEVVRMLHTLLGPQSYRQGTDLFFNRHDGEAATTDDFISALQTASGKDLSQFSLWYSQVGTPFVRVFGLYNEDGKTFTLIVRQSSKQTLNLPLEIALVGKEGLLPLCLHDSEVINQQSLVLEINQSEQKFVFKAVNERPVPSLFRNFSAPVIYSYDYSQADLLQIMAKDSSDYCRWEASYLLWIQQFKRELKINDINHEIKLPAEIVDYYRNLLHETKNNPNQDMAVTTQLLTLPCANDLLVSKWLLQPIDITRLAKICIRIKKCIANLLKPEFEALYGIYEIAEPASLMPNAMAQRALNNIALDYLAATDDPIWLQHSYQQFQLANTLTDTIAALKCLVHSEIDEATLLKEKALNDFYQCWRKQPLVMNQWLKVQACSPSKDTLSSLQELLSHSAFSLENPSQVYALIGTFAEQNILSFHNENGSAYRFFVDQIIKLNSINPQVGSRLLSQSPFINWRRYDKKREGLMYQQLQRLHATSSLAIEISDVVNKCLHI